MGRRAAIIGYTRENDRLIKIHILGNTHYDVRRDGTVWTRISTNGCGLIPDGSWRRCDVPENRGYRVVSLTVDGKRKKLRVHRMVYLKFIGALNPTKIINHIDGDKWNNKPENLEQISIKENNDHKYDSLGHDPIQNFKISYEIADEIRALKREGWTHRELCKKFKLSKSNISYIVNNKIWVRPGGSNETQDSTDTSSTSVRSQHISQYVA